MSTIYNKSKTIFITLLRYEKNIIKSKDPVRIPYTRVVTTTKHKQIHKNRRKQGKV